MSRKKGEGRKKRRFPVRIVFFGLITYILLLVMLFAVFTPEQYDLKVGQVSPITITASKDVEDTITTQQLIDEAVSAVPAVYRLDDSVETEVASALSDGFDRLVLIRQLEQQAITEESSDTFEQRLVMAKEIMADFPLSEEDYNLIVDMPEEQFELLESLSMSEVSTLYASLVTDGGMDEALARFTRDLAVAGELSDDALSFAERFIRNWFRANIVYDEEATQLNREKAADEVEPVMYLKGRNIVRSGEIITRTQIAMLESLGLLMGTRTLDVGMYAGVALLVLLALIMLCVYMAVFEREILTDPIQMILLCVIILITCGVCVVVQTINQFLVPVVLGAMLTTLLLRSRLALIVNIALAVMNGLINSGVTGSFSTSLIIEMMTGIVSGSLCIALMHNKPQRLVVLLAGLLACGSNMLVTLGVGLITELNTSNVVSWALWCGGSSLLASVLSIGLQPLLEWIFNLVTPAKLMELSNPNHPLIRRMILEASGTYHHSIIVANLAEAAADAIGANGLLARVGAYYHDIGKLKRPMYFKENQIGDNPHDRTDPMVSAAILTAHPTDGVALAEKYRMPRPILDIIQQHHGDTPVIYFYDRCVRQNGAENVDIDDFRYPGPKPQTREAAVVMLADTIEAAARTSPDRSIEGLETLIRKLIRGKMDDGQLNDTPMTLADVEKATEAFLTVLSGVFHQRVEYPDLQIPPKKEKAHRESEEKRAEKEGRRRAAH